MTTRLTARELVTTWSQQIDGSAPWSADLFRLAEAIEAREAWLRADIERLRAELKATALPEKP